jgi:hypothetical protein
LGVVQTSREETAGPEAARVQIMRLWDKTQHTDDTLSNGEFVWDEKANEYRRPQGLPLKSNWPQFKNPRTHITQADTIVYRANSKYCGICPQKSNCCPNTTHRKVVRSIYEGARNVPRKIAETNALKGLDDSARKWKCCLPISSAS